MEISDVKKWISEGKLKWNSGDLIMNMTAMEFSLLSNEVKNSSLTCVICNFEDVEDRFFPYATNLVFNCTDNNPEAVKGIELIICAMNYKELDNICDIFFENIPMRVKDIAPLIRTFPRLYSVHFYNTGDVTVEKLFEDNNEDDYYSINFYLVQQRRQKCIFAVKSLDNSVIQMVTDLDQLVV